jgi:hypothetical protein
MKKDHKNILAEYPESLSDEHLIFLGARLTENQTGDMREAIDFMSRNHAMDRVLGSAESVGEFFDFYDAAKDSVLRECRKRKISMGRQTA